MIQSAPGASLMLIKDVNCGPFGFDNNFNEMIGPRVHGEPRKIRTECFVITQFRARCFSYIDICIRAVSPLWIM